MIKIIFSLFLFPLFGGLCLASENRDIERFVRLLSEKNVPTLADYYYSYGRGAEEEIQLAFLFCRKKGWVPVLQNKKCLAYIENREKKPHETPSLYLAWLRKKLPNSPKVTINRVEQVTGGDVISHELVYASLDNVDVVFFETLDSKNVDQFGRISISEINGVAIKEIFENDLKKTDPIAL